MYDWSQSSSAHCLEAGEYYIKVILLTSGTERLDCIDFAETPVPVRTSSWGAVRALFR